LQVLTEFKYLDLTSHDLTKHEGAHVEIRREAEQHYVAFRRSKNVRFSQIAVFSGNMAAYSMDFRQRVARAWLHNSADSAPNRQLK
jgi:hypothetical protein